MAIWTLAKKELKLLIRDWRALFILVVMPMVFVLVLGLLLGEAFGQKQDDKLRVSLVDLDEGLPTKAGLIGGERWFDIIKRDLAETADKIKIEIIPTEKEARELVADHKRAAVLIFKSDFSSRMAQCSFLKDGINPFHRDGVYLEMVGAELLKDSKQPGAASIIDQVAQATLLRVTLPWMIGKAFERLSDEQFIDLLCDQVHLPVPKQFGALFKVDDEGKASLQELLGGAARSMALFDKKKQAAIISDYKQRVGRGVQEALKQQFEKYNLTGMTWAALTKSKGEGQQRGEISAYQHLDGSGPLRRGAHRYQILVPSYTVMFAFFLVVTVGWVFVAERRQGTLKRLRLAPVRRTEILFGKLVPYFLLSLGQGGFLLLCGKIVFGMSWGPDDWPWWQQIALLVPVVFTTSAAAMGLALLVAAVARSELQVALYGAIPVLILALIGGCMLPREWMPEQTQEISLLTPHGWALNAYRELLDVTGAEPNLKIVFQSCAVLTGFGLGFVLLAGLFLRLD